VLRLVNVRLGGCGRDRPRLRLPPLGRGDYVHSLTASGRPARDIVAAGPWAAHDLAEAVAARLEAAEEAARRLERELKTCVSVLSSPSARSAKRSHPVQPARCRHRRGRIRPTAGRQRTPRSDFSGSTPSRPSSVPRRDIRRTHAEFVELLQQSRRNRTEATRRNCSFAQGDRPHTYDTIGFLRAGG